MSSSISIVVADLNVSLIDASSISDNCAADKFVAEVDFGTFVGSSAIL
jgi:hypothetical protein